MHILSRVFDINIINHIFLYFMNDVWKPNNAESRLNIDMVSILKKKRISNDSVIMMYDIKMVLSEIVHDLTETLFFHNIHSKEKHF